MDGLPQISFKNDDRKIPGFQCIAIDELLKISTSKDSEYPFKPHRIEFYAILIINSGVVKHFVDLQEYTLGAGDCMVIRKGQIQAFNATTKYDGHIILFTQEFGLKFMSGPSLDKISQLHGGYGTSQLHANAKGNAWLLDNLNTELKSGENAYTKTEVVANLIATFLLRINRGFETLEPEDRDAVNFKLFVQFRDLVERDFATSRDANYYADILGFSYKHLNEISKRFTKMTAKQFVDNHIILEIKRSAISTNLSNKELSYLFGFDEPTNFLKYFKRNTGYSLVELRSK